MTKWEYLVVNWEVSTSGPDTWENAYYIRRPDGTRERIAGDVVWAEYLNRLGADGWELVTERMHNSVIFGGQTNGWNGVAGPIVMAFTFKRAVG